VQSTKSNRHKMNYQFPFEKLKVWQLAIDFADEIYDLTGEFPLDERFGLVSQMNRAAVSVSSNLAEGTTRRSFNDQVRFTTIAYSSLMEVMSQCVLSERRKYITSDQLVKTRNLVMELSIKINNLRQYQLSQSEIYVSGKGSNHVKETMPNYGDNLLEQPEGLVERPKDNLNVRRTVEQLNDLTIEQYFNHPTAIIDPNTKIGKDTKIWHFSHIMSNSIIGEACNIGQNVVISPDVVLGNNVKVQNNVSIYTGVICEDDVFLGPSMVFTNVINPRSAISRKSEYLETIVKKGATIGANATIVCGHNIGRYAFIGAGAVVTKEIPDYALVVGNPAKQIGWMSEYGERLIFDESGKAVCGGSGDTYFLKDGVVEKLDVPNLNAAGT